MAAPKLKSSIDTNDKMTERKLFLVDEKYLNSERQKKIDKYKKNVLIEYAAEVISCAIVFCIYLFLGAALFKSDSEENKK